MAIMFKWEDKVNGRVEKSHPYYRNEVIGSVQRLNGKLVADIELGESRCRIAGQRATQVKNAIQERLGEYANELVTVYSIFDQKQEKPIQIRRGDRGGVGDPSMESYHSF